MKVSLVQEFISSLACRTLPFHPVRKVLEQTKVTGSAPCMCFTRFPALSMMYVCERERRCWRKLWKNALTVAACSDTVRLLCEKSAWAAGRHVICEARGVYASVVPRLLPSCTFPSRRASSTPGAAAYN